MKKRVVLLIVVLFLLLTFLRGAKATDISVCSDLDTPNDVYYLIDDIYSTYQCMNVKTFNVVLDCQGHHIVGPGYTYVGILSSYQLNTTVRNCILENWFYGIYYQNSNDGLIKNVTTNFNVDGIHFENSDNNNLETITSSNNNNFGLYFTTSDNINITNVTSNYNVMAGILFEVSNNNQVTNAIANSNTNYGIDFYSSTNDALKNVSTNLNQYGVRLSESNNIRLSKIFSSLNYGGILIEGSVNNIVNDSTLHNNSFGMIFSSTPSYYPTFNIIYNNLFNNTNNSVFNSAPLNYFNTTKTQGTNIIGGSYIGGNYWTNLLGTGYSDTCSDTDKNGFCDNLYNLTPDSPNNNVDYLPLSRIILAYCGDNNCDPGETCSNCRTDCGSCPPPPPPPPQPVYSLNISGLISLIEINQSSSNATCFVVKNTGNTKLENVSVKLSGIPSTWYGISPSSISELNVTGNISVCLGFAIPQDAEVNDYLLSINVSNNKATRSASMTLRVLEKIILPTSCPQCLNCTEWSDCVDNERGRICYYCNSTTNYFCKGLDEIESCGTGFVFSVYYLLIIPVVGVILSLLLYMFNLLPFGPKCPICSTRMKPKFKGKFVNEYRCPKCGYEVTKQRK